MKWNAFLATTSMALACLTPNAAAQWTEDFDSYETGSGLAGQGGWITWCDAPEPQFDALVSDAHARSAPHSVEIAGSSDVVRQFFPPSQPLLGQWTLTAYQYIPVDATGHGSFNVMNVYDVELPWYWVNRSFIVKFYCEEGMVESKGDGAKRPLIKGQWVELRVEIDLDIDTAEFYYNGEILTRKSWADGYTGLCGDHGRLSIGGLNLYADACSPVYYDDLSLEGSITLGACCDPWTGDCVDNTDIWDCTAQGFQAFLGQQCAELNPACGNPGCCCDDEAGEVSETLELNCSGRFLPNVLGDDCYPYAFFPPCGETPDVLYAPSYNDWSGFRNELAAILWSNVDYFDARAATPTLDLLLQYDCVLTWRQEEYDDRVGMGNVLADYVDLGGKVILGQGCVPGLEGRIMEPEYCPVASVSGTGYGTYAGDGVDCVHTGIGGLNPVNSYSADSNWRDIATLRSGPFASDGTFQEDGSLAVVFRLDRAVYYSPGHTGGTLDPPMVEQDWPELTANMILCPGVPIADLNGDGCVDLSDLATLLANYGTTTGMLYEDGDLDADGDVDLSDLAVLLAHYGEGCP